MSNTDTSLVGMFGGTFDPIHYGHLRVAEEIVEVVGLRKMYFIPAGQPRLRHTPIATPEHRVELVRLAIKENPDFMLDDREIHRDGTSYSIDSVFEIKQELGEADRLCFVIGLDAFIKLPEWKDWREFFNLCHFIITARPGYVFTSIHELLPKRLDEEYSRRWVSSTDSLRNYANGLIFTVSTSMLDISATCIRKKIASGRNVRYLVPDMVISYIKANKLYL